MKGTVAWCKVRDNFLLLSLVLYGIRNLLFMSFHSHIRHSHIRHFLYKGLCGKKMTSIKCRQRKGQNEALRNFTQTGKQINV